ncbi:MAG: hypothetical protein JWQ59_1482, partial [Cryobacterium sp.]|nr:hypothetical protein [Cryobacterium sp.]
TASAAAKITASARARARMLTKASTKASVRVRTAAFGWPPLCTEFMTIAHHPWPPLWGQNRRRVYRGAAPSKSTTGASTA